MLDKRTTFGVHLIMVKKNTAVRIKEKDLEELKRLAKKEDGAVSSLIRQAIREFLDRKKAVNAK